MPEPTDLQAALILVSHATSYLETAQRYPGEWYVDGAARCLRAALALLEEPTPKAGVKGQQWPLIPGTADDHLRAIADIIGPYGLDERAIEDATGRSNLDQHHTPPPG